MLLCALCFQLLAVVAVLGASDVSGPSSTKLAQAILGYGGGGLSPPNDKVATGVRCGVPLGLSTGYISSAQITASSSLVNHDTNGVRLLRAVSPVNAWCSSPSNNQQWVQVDLLQQTKVTGVATQGRNRVNQWIRTYKIQYSNNAASWTTYKEDGQDKVFQGNADQNSVVKNDFLVPFTARYVRIHPLTWFGYVCLRVEFYGCLGVCKSGLGMVSGALDSSRLAASSSLNDVHDERGSRLLTNVLGARSLSVQFLNTDQYLQIDVGLVTTIHAVATQGRDAVAQWVKTYLLHYSTDGSKWLTYKQGGTAKIFAGNTDSRAVVTHRLSPTFKARYVRIHPQTYQGYISFRAEVFGCPRECDFPLGMTTGEIDAYHISTSSDHNPVHDQRGARLLTDTLVAAWAAKYNDVNQWIQVDFGGLRKVTGVATQGRTYYAQWVTTYFVSYSNDGYGWTLYHEPGKQSPELFPGNADQDEVTKNTFYPPIVAKAVRVLPQSWHVHLSMRVEFFGCHA